MSPLTGNHTVFLFWTSMAARVPGGHVIITETSATSLVPWLIHQAGRGASQKELTLRWLRLRELIHPSLPPLRLDSSTVQKGNHSWRLGVEVVFLSAWWPDAADALPAADGIHRRPSDRFEKMWKWTWFDPDTCRAELQTPWNDNKTPIVKCFIKTQLFVFPAWCVFSFFSTKSSDVFVSKDTDAGYCWKKVYSPSN